MAALNFTNQVSTTTKIMAALNFTNQVSTTTKIVAVFDFTKLASTQDNQNVFNLIKQAFN